MNRPLLAAILLFSSLGIGFFLTWPKFQEFQSLSGEVKAKQQELENRENYFANLRETKQSTEPFGEQLGKLHAALPTVPQLPSLYDFLQQEASFSGLSLNSIAASSKETAAGKIELQRIPVSLELTGSYNAAKQLLSRLQAASRMTELETLTLSRAQDGVRFSLSVQLNAFSY